MKPTNEERRDIAKRLREPEYCPYCGAKVVDE